MREAWYYTHEGHRGGPIKPQELRVLAQAGKIAADDLVWREGLADWISARQLKGLRFVEPERDATRPPPRIRPVEDRYVPPDTDPDFDEPGDCFQSARPRRPSDSFDEFDFYQASRFAGFWQRVGAHMIDSMVCSPVMGVAFFFLILILAVVSRAGGNSPSDAAAVSFLVILVFGYMSILMIPIAYYSIMEASHYQGTLGKLALGLKVTDLQGRRLRLGWALARNLVKFFIFIGVVAVAFTVRKQALHDIVASSVVVAD